MEKHGGQLEVLHLHECSHPAVLTALPCPQLQDVLELKQKADLLLGGWISLDGRVWSDIAAATNLTCVSLHAVWTESRQADVVSALTALPDLEQLTWRRVRCGRHLGLSDSKLLQKLTKLTALKLASDGAASALEHLGLLTRLQDLSLAVTAAWAAARCPGLQELKALTRLELLHGFGDAPVSVSQLTALQQLEVPSATTTALDKLSALTGLTRLHVGKFMGLSSGSSPLQLPRLQHLRVGYALESTMPMSYLVTCTQLQVLKLRNIHLSSPGTLAASSMLQHLELRFCRVSAAVGAANIVPWQHVFTGPGRLPYLTSLQLIHLTPILQHADMECVAACCSSLQVLDLDTPWPGATSALTCLTGLTSLTLSRTRDKQCSSLAQLTGLRELRMYDASEVSAAGLHQLAALEQLTSLELYSQGWSSDVLREHVSHRLSGPFTYTYAIINQVCVYVCAYLRVWGRGIMGCNSWHPTLLLLWVAWQAQGRYTSINT